MIYICEPDNDFAIKIKACLSEKNIASEIVDNGKDCQLKVYKKVCRALILDLNTDNHPAFAVLKYMRLNYPEVRIILTLPGSNIYEKLSLASADLRKLGVSSILIKPYSLDKLVKCVEGESQLEAWKNITSTGSKNSEENIIAQDADFTRVKLESFYSGNTTIFDVYIRLGENKFIKILHQGDAFDETRLQKYRSEKIEYLYFKTKDRGVYINYMNNLLKLAIGNSKMSCANSVTSLKNVTEKYIEEIYTMGIRTELLEEGKEICQNVYNLLKRNKDISQLMKSYEDYDPPAYAHLFLVSFFSVLILKNMEWSSARTAETIAMGALLHDIGKLKLPLDLRESNQSMTSEQIAKYRQHPLLGAQLLQNSSHIQESVIQIVYQHHEFVNGTGYPNGLSGSKIYPLAKIVSLANEFSTLLVENHVTPLVGLTEFISSKERIERHDSMAIKSLVMGFMKDKK